MFMHRVVWRGTTSEEKTSFSGLFFCIFEIEKSAWLKVESYKNLKSICGMLWNEQIACSNWLKIDSDVDFSHHTDLLWVQWAMLSPLLVKCYWKWPHVCKYSFFFPFHWELNWIQQMKKKKKNEIEKWSNKIKYMKAIWLHNRNLMKR